LLIISHHTHQVIRWVTPEAHHETELVYLGLSVSSTRVYKQGA
jgi:hypothetical protein